MRKSIKKDNNNSNEYVENSDVTLVDWECPICNQMNNGRDIVCVLCGVPKINKKETSEEVTIKSKKRKDTSSKNKNSSYISNNITGNNLMLKNNSNYDGISSLSYVSSSKVVIEQVSKQKVLKIECKACSYINEGNIDYCQICGSRLDSQKILPSVKPIVCSICLFSNEPGSTLCSICSMPLRFCASTFDPDANKNDDSLLYSNNNGINNTYYDTSRPIHYPSIIDAPAPVSVPSGYDLRNPYNNLSSDSKYSINSSPPVVPPKDNMPLIDSDDDDDNLSPIAPTSPKLPSQSSSLNSLKGETYRIKLLFKSGQTHFYNELCQALSEEQWKVITYFILILFYYFINLILK